MILYKKIRLKPDGTGPAIGVVMSDGKGKVAFSMAKNAKKMFDQNTGAKIFSMCCMFQDVDEFNEFEGIGRCMKKLFANHDDIKDIQTRFAHKITPTNVETFRKLIYAKKEERSKIEVPTTYNEIDRILAELIEMKERSFRYYKQ